MLIFQIALFHKTVSFYYFYIIIECTEYITTQY